MKRLTAWFIFCAVAVCLAAFTGCNGVRELIPGEGEIPSIATTTTTTTTIPPMVEPTEATDRIDLVLVVQGLYFLLGNVRGVLDDLVGLAVLVHQRAVACLYPNFLASLAQPEKFAFL